MTTKPPEPGDGPKADDLVDQRDQRLAPVTVFDVDGQPLNQSRAIEASARAAQSNRALLREILIELRTIRVGIQVLCGPITIGDPGPPPNF